ncbi:ATP-binding protein [Halomonas sp. EGI 63088]|uniref:ATP-binding protein n=1 Tax=Halomonas flagellata TaxID=2920385 RepID=A0ABS9RY47_9GAMM|nr:ATP-binding protein [Halomonas flagellata]
MSRLRERERQAILNSLRTGVVPRVGQQHIQVGRAAELKALISDIATLADGGSAVRFIIGEYGSGKTFFLNLVGSIAREKKLVTVSADLSPDRRLHATGGQGRALYAMLMRNMATRAKPDGGALASVTERFVTQALQQADQAGISPEAAIKVGLDSLMEMHGGYAFAEVVQAYWRGHDTGNVELQQAAIQWLRGEFSTKTEARQALGVRTIIDDANVYQSLKLMARFVRLAGFEGLLVTLDEMVNLYKLSNSQARNANYEQILGIVNDALQGSTEGLGVMFGGTPEFLMDPRRGLYSYEALQSRLAENRFARDGLVDLSGPVIRLTNLTQEDLYLLLVNIRRVFARGESGKDLLPDEGLEAFLDHCHSQIGDAYFKTPRNSVKEFTQFLSLLEQNPGVSWDSLVKRVEVASESPDQIPEAPSSQSGSPSPEVPPAPAPASEVASQGDEDEDDDSFATFKL